MMRSKIKELTDDVVENAKFIFHKMKCRQAYINYVAVKEMKDSLERQEKMAEELINTCADAAHTIQNYKKLIRIAQDTVGETTWQEILTKAYKESDCSNDA